LTLRVSIRRIHWREMIKQLTDSGRLKITALLTAMSAFAFTLSVARFYFSETTLFLFLNWNLFLAFIPWAVSSMIILKPALRKNRTVLFFSVVIWLLFFPNAPYILTDLFHLKARASVPIWFDLVVILSFAWTGLIFGFVSLLDIEMLLKEFFNKRIVNCTIALLLFIGSFGVYIGRYLRWNSWDILQAPFQLLYDVGDRMINPLQHPGTWGMTILMGTLLNLMFWTIKYLSGRPIRISEENRA
jgi:uncharacterized membrane protein